MSMNGDLGPEKSYLPLEVEVTRDSSPAAHGPAFSLAQIAPKVPSPNIAKSPLVRGTATPSPFRNAYREIRYGIETLKDRQGLRTIGIVSVSDGDGKSLTATNLALTLTEGGKRRVALLDACFGSPSIATLLGAEAPVGLAEVLAGKISPERAMFASEQPGLFAMSAGNLETAGIDPLDAAETFSVLANRLATVFDYVIVDAQALEESVDGAALASKLDGVVLVVKAGKTKAAEVDAAIAKLGEGKVVGLVLNGAA